MNLRMVFFLLFLCFQQVFATGLSSKVLTTVASRLSKDQFRVLAKYTSAFLQDNIHHLACQKNESGFVRFNIPAPPAVDMRSDISKIRLNYWADDEHSMLDPETVHNHPRYFESLIINGGYTHELYEKHLKQGKGHPYSTYRIFKDLRDRKKFMYLGQSSLSLLHEESTGKESLVCVPTTLIHRVLTTEPSTLSLNVVYTDPEEQDMACYDVYLSERGGIEDIKTKREILVNGDALKLAREVKGLLDDFIATEI